jgi:hypothetical protein
VSDHLAEVLREPLRELIPSDTSTEVFDRFEYLLAIAYGDLDTDETVLGVATEGSSKSRSPSKPARRATAREDGGFSKATIQRKA